MKLRALVVITAALLAATPAAAADKTHQQLMAEIRMLQEQQAQLQQMLRGLADTLRTMTAKIDEQTGSMRKGFADQRLVADNIAEGVRILREKADDTNVRLSTMTQEMESMRAAMQSMPAPSVGVPPAPGDPTQPPSGNLPSTPTGSSSVSPQKAYDAAFNDYTGGQYDLAIAGFEFYIKSFPTSPRADDAQLNIGNSYFAMGSFKEAVVALQRVISEYPQSDSAAQAYYKLGQSYEALKQVELARRAYETLIKSYPNDVGPAQLAKQRLDSLNKK
ncbi:MAG: tetratricopeptide repeat protein [Acidobacteria bacterium]|nr:tetratricopeptide repeat protein [Acidobacteriota bacterium]